MDDTNYMQPPSWLNISFLETALANTLKSKGISITSVDIKPAVGKNENYVSRIFRIKLETNEQKTHKKQNRLIIIKILPENEKMQKKIQESKEFVKEARMLAVVIPAMHKLIGDASSIKKFAPTCIYHQGAPNDVIIMEDLCDLGYKLANRLEGLDLAHSLLVVQTLATYHAGMSILTQSQFQDLRKINDEKFDSTCRKFLAVPVIKITDALKNDNEVPKKIIDKMESLGETIREKSNEAWLFDKKCKLNTYLHDDLWINNMLFKYDDNGKVVDCVFVDFQNGTYNSGMLDLVYFIFTSIKDDLRIPNINTILQIYYDTFISVFRTKGIDLNLSFFELQGEYRKRLFYGLNSLLITHPIVFAPLNDALDLNEMLEYEANDDIEPSNVRPFQNKTFIEVLKRLLPYFDENGVF